MEEKFFAKMKVMTREGFETIREIILAKDYADSIRICVNNAMDELATIYPEFKEIENKEMFKHFFEVATIKVEHIIKYGDKSLTKKDRLFLLQSF